MVLRLTPELLKHRWYVVLPRAQAQLVREAHADKTLQRIEDVFTPEPDGSYAVELEETLTFVTVVERPDQLPVYRVKTAGPVDGLKTAAVLNPLSFDDYALREGVDISALSVSRAVERQKALADDKRRRKAAAVRPVPPAIDAPAVTAEDKSTYYPLVGLLLDVEPVSG